MTAELRVMLPPAVELRDMDKSFYGVFANADVDFSLARGEVHALLGENGAGKSTLCSVIAGLYRPDSGEMLMDGESVAFKSPKDALAAGVGMVYQHFRLVSNLTVAENLALGNPKWGFAFRRANSKPRHVNSENATTSRSTRRPVSGSFRSGSSSGLRS